MVEASVSETEAGVYSVLAGSTVYEVRVAAGEIVVNGHVFTCEIEDLRAWKSTDAGAGAHGRAAITAPMPGKVVRILAAVGEEVKAGQGIIVVEAMKMQNEMKAPRDGRVTALNVRENDSVTPGSILATIE